MTRERFLGELAEIRQRIASLEALEAERQSTENALQESEELSRGLLEAATVGTYIVQDGRFRYVNPRFEEITGYTKDELIGTHSLTYVHPDDRELVRDRAIEDLKGHSSLSYEFRFVHKDGRPLWVLERVASIQYQGRPAAVGSFMDITERKRAEEELRESEELSRGLLEAATVGTYIVQDGRFRYVNPQFEEITGYTKDEVAGTYSLTYVHPDDRELVRNRAIEGLKGHSSLSYEFRFVHKDGRSLWILERVASIQYQGRPAAVGSFMDITERKGAEDDLRQSEERLKTVIENAPDAMHVHDLNGTFLDGNKRAEELVGYRREELVGRNFIEAGLLPEEYVAKAAELLEKSTRGQATGPDELELIRKDGSRVTVEISSIPVQRGDQVEVVNIVRDVTERKRAEEALRSSEERYRLLAENATDFIWAMDMDLRFFYVSPSVTALLGYGVDEAMALTVEELIGPNDAKAAVKILAEEPAAEQGTEPSNSRTLEVQLKRKDGSTVWVESRMKFIRDASGEPVGIAGMSRDIAQRKRAEEETLRHSKRLEALHAITVAVSQSLDLNHMLNSALDAVLAVVEADGGYIHLLDQAKKELVLKAHRGVPQQYVEAIERMGVRDEAFERWQEYPEPAFRVDGIVTEEANAQIAMAERGQRFELLVGVPLWSKSGMHGGLTLVGREPRRLSPEELDLLKAIGNEIAVGIENVKLLEKTRELSVTDELTGLKNRRNFYEVLDAETERTERYGLSFSLVMLDLDGFKDYNDRFGHTNGDAVLKSLGRRLTLSLRKSDTAFRYGGDEFAIVLPETDASKSRKMVDRIRYEWLKAPKSEAPLMEESRLTFSAGIAQFPQNAQTADGLVFLADTALYRSKREGGHKSALVSELGTLASGSVDRETLDHVYALAATVDARDPYTYGHSKRVAAIAEMIGGAARLPPDDLAHLRGAALLHDIGKVGVPDSTLGKPGKLTEDEWEVIRKHCDEGARIVSHVKALEALVPLIRHHHEWYDGSGYPGGLAGERIPVGARIIAIADAYDTMTTRRPYRAPVSREEAIEELRRCSGTQFDAVLVGSFGEALRGAVWEGGMKKKKLSLARR